MLSSAKFPSTSSLSNALSYLRLLTDSHQAYSISLTVMDQGLISPKSVKTFSDELARNVWFFPVVPKALVSRMPSWYTGRCHHRTTRMQVGRYLNEALRKWSFYASLKIDSNHKCGFCRSNTWKMELTPPMNERNLEWRAKRLKPPLTRAFSSIFPSFFHSLYQTFPKPGQAYC